MARRSRKSKSILGSLAVELSALAGILGLTQPAFRDQLWNAWSGAARSTTLVVAPNTAFDPPTDAGWTGTSRSKFQSLPLQPSQAANNPVIAQPGLAVQAERSVNLAEQVLWPVTANHRY